MGAAGLTIKVEAHMQRVPRSERSGEVIEPLVSSQWFVKMDGMAKKGCDAVRDGSIQIIPQRFEKVYFNWLENIQVRIASDCHLWPRMASDDLG